MSDVNLDFTVSNNSIGFTVQPNDITITPTDIQLSFYTAPAPAAAGLNGELQFNLGGILGGISNVTSDGGNVTFANVSNINIGGGNNHYYLQTDGTGNLTWAVGTGNMQGNGTVAGANTQIQFNDGGANFGGNAGFTFNKINGNVDIPGNLIVVGNIFGNAQTAYLANFATVANSVAGANVFGEVSFAAVANSVAGANVSGFVANATNANNASYAGNITIGAQPNITSVGTLTSLSVSGNISANSYLGQLGNLSYGIENLDIIGAQTGTYNMDLITSAIKYSTANASANLILNFRGNSTISLNTLLPNSHSITSTYVLTNGATPYDVSSITIDGSAQSIKWVNGAVPTAASNASTSYTFTIVKTATTPTYNVLGSATRYS
jgi:hypothetical protein